MYVILFSICLSLSLRGVAQTSVSDFKLRYHADQKGDIVLVSNSIVTCKGCGAVNQLPPGSGSSNNEFVSQYIDIDNTAETFNSSSAELSLPDCSTISFAGLYWGGSLSASNSRYKVRDKVKLKLPGSSDYLDLSADILWEGQFFKDITELVKAAPSVSGLYTVANIVVDEEIKNSYGGWTIVVVYENSLMALRNLSVFDGLASLHKHQNLSVRISGFSTPPAGPVSIDFGFVAYDGDRGYSGDFMAFNSQVVSDRLHDPDNFFNSSIASKGALVTSRLPAYSNTLGYDASIVRPDNSALKYLKNGATEAIIYLSTKEEGYDVGVFTSAIDVYDPIFQFAHSYRNLSSGKDSLKSGEVAEIEYVVKNVGNDKSRNTIFLDSIPALTEFVEGSLEVRQADGDWVRITDRKGDDEGEFLQAEGKLMLRLGEGADDKVGGAVLPSQEVRVRYQIRLTGDCRQLYCSPGPISKHGKLSYWGNVNNTEIKVQLSAPMAATMGCMPVGPLIIPLKSCEPEEFKELRLKILCKNTPVLLKDGALLYEETDIDFNNPLSSVSDAGTYVARGIYPGGCSYSYKVIVETDFLAITEQPEPIELDEGQDAEFSISVVGAGALIQWQVNNGNGVWSDLTGETGATLLLAKVGFEKNGYRYRARVTNGCSVLTSEAALLSVKKLPIPPFPEPRPPVSNPPLPPVDRDTLYVPNAFKPGSSVQELRHFMVKGQGIAKWTMRIFNKWDQLIWETDKLNADGSPAEGWDGSMFGGAAPQGAYMWVIRAVFNDGREWQGSSGYFKKSKPKCSGVFYLLR